MCRTFPSFRHRPRGSTAVLGTNYLGVTNTLVFPPGEVFQTVTIPVIHDFAITPDLTVSNYLSNPQPAVAGGPGIGNQPNALLTIINVDSGVSFSAATYFFTEDSGSAVIPVSAAAAAAVTTVDFVTTTNGTALACTNYLPVFTNLTFVDGQTTLWSRCHSCTTPDAGRRHGGPAVEQRGGLATAQPAETTLTIADVDHAPGQLFFAATNYVVSEGAGSLAVTVLGTNGRRAPSR